MGLVMITVRKIVLNLGGNVEQQLLGMNQEYKQLAIKRESLCEDKTKLEDEALKIFTLYEITREITKSLSEEEALRIFNKKLHENVVFDDCQMFDFSTKEINKYKTKKDSFVFTLKSKKRNIGFLVIKELSGQDKEKVMILGHQFALALRRVKLYKEIERVAIMDSLTEVHTRRYSLDRFQEELERSRTRKIKLSFLMIDVDYFKKFNDQYGHLTGDQILREIADIIKDNVREIDVAGRYGGEEFCVILPDTDREGARYVAERVRQATETTPIRAYDTTVQTTVSIGISTFPDDGKNINELVDKADWALYRSKKLGRNRVTSFGIYKD